LQVHEVGHLPLEERSAMMCFYSTRERLDELLRLGSFPTAFPEACWWAGRHAIGNLDIDLGQDDCQEIMWKLERWEMLESHSLLIRQVGSLYASMP
jgi:hypothetical protein